MTISMDIALTKTMQRGHKQIATSRQYKRQMKNMKKMQKKAVIKMLTMN